MKLPDEQKNVFSGVMSGYIVLVLHVVLMLLLGITVVFLKGIYDLRWLILLGGLALLGASGYYFYHHFKRHRQAFDDLIHDPALQDRTLEISLLGGLASVKVGHRDEAVLLENATSEIKQLAAPHKSKLEQLEELSLLLDKQLISEDEFQRLKSDIFASEQEATTDKDGVI